MLDILKKIAQIGIISEPRLDLQQSVIRIFGRSIAIRHVDAGSCNGCELEINALSNPYYNLEGYGIHFVASPRHADILLVTVACFASYDRSIATHLRRDAKS